MGGAYIEKGQEFIDRGGRLKKAFPGGGKPFFQLFIRELRRHRSLRFALKTRSFYTKYSITNHLSNFPVKRLVDQSLDLGLRHPVLPQPDLRANEELALVVAAEDAFDDSLGAQCGLNSSDVSWFGDEIGSDLEVERTALSEDDLPLCIYAVVVNLDMMAVLVSRPSLIIHWIRIHKEDSLYNYSGYIVPPNKIKPIVKPRTNGKPLP
ncbi:phosphoenolpyruvate carboxylase 1 [Striga asiatica]|uniref:Phosphoenolpyruvate carboxylase 1 n=1 Tax=Striga asiatica TaxID=4170 RepID=A0A5A7R2U5_STRAF|nr:phosphoenolpyruvate carboxylase 1 [Striga asiatica]